MLVGGGARRRAGRTKGPFGTIGGAGRGPRCVTPDWYNLTMTCEAKYPDSSARCSLRAHHQGSHCSQSHGVIWPNLEDAALRKGAKVRLGKRAVGVVASVDRMGTPERSAILLLDSGREKRVTLRTAPLRVTPARMKGVASKPFRLCTGCGEAVCAED
jgi:hypothetical protein